MYKERRMKRANERRDEARAADVYAQGKKDIEKLQEMPPEPTHYTGLSGKITFGSTNDPKAEAGAKKVPLGNISLVAQYYEAAVMARGSSKHDTYDWCDRPRKASVCINSIRRHLTAWEGGEDLDPKSGYPHMAHLRANTGILIDQQEAGRLIDDRPKNLAPLAPVVKKILAILHPSPAVTMDEAMQKMAIDFDHDDLEEEVRQIPGSRD